MPANPDNPSSTAEKTDNKTLLLHLFRSKGGDSNFRIHLERQVVFLVCHGESRPELHFTGGNGASTGGI